MLKWFNWPSRIYVDLCRFMWIYAIYLVLFFEKLCHLWWFFPDLFANKSTSRAVNECKWFNPKKMEISRFIWVPVTTDQFCLVHLILKKNIMQFRTGKHHQAICDSFLWITLGEFREWKKHIPRNSQSHLADRGFRCHLPPGLLENPPCSDVFSHKKKCPVRGFSSRVWF